VYVDPWLTGNPVCPLRLQDIYEVTCVCVSHGHRDHLGDAIALCQKTGALLIACPEICAFAARHGIEYEKQSYGLNIGGTWRRDPLAVTMVQAFHTSEIQGPAYRADRTLDPGGGACGFMLRFDRWTVYFTGDTGIFGDMALLTQIYHPHLVILPIGGKYTMGPIEAAWALGLMRPPLAIPCHYDTFADQRVDLAEFRRLVAERSPQTEVICLAPGAKYRLADA